MLIVKGTLTLTVYFSAFIVRQRIISVLLLLLRLVLRQALPTTTSITDLWHFFNLPSAFLWNQGLSKTAKRKHIRTRDNAKSAASKLQRGSLVSVCATKSFVSNANANCYSWCIVYHDSKGFIYPLPSRVYLGCLRCTSRFRIGET